MESTAVLGHTLFRTLVPEFSSIPITYSLFLLLFLAVFWPTHFPPSKPLASPEVRIPFSSFTVLSLPMGSSLQCPITVTHVSCGRLKQIVGSWLANSSPYPELSPTVDGYDCTMLLGAEAALDLTLYGSSLHACKLYLVFSDFFSWLYPSIWYPNSLVWCSLILVTMFDSTYSCVNDIYKSTMSYQETGQSGMTKQSPQEAKKSFVSTQKVAQKLHRMYCDIMAQTSSTVLGQLSQNGWASHISPLYESTSMVWNSKAPVNAIHCKFAW